MIQKHLPLAFLTPGTSIAKLSTTVMIFVAKKASVFVIGKNFLLGFDKHASLLCYGIN
jgi:hypothetical protein